jgi:hypothetical protein
MILTVCAPVPLNEPGPPRLALASMGKPDTEVGALC